MAFKLIVVATSLALGSSAAQGVRAPVTLHDLTVPQEWLPAECTLPPQPSVRLDDNKIRGGLWANLPISTNPWAGTDIPAMVSIRERMDAPWEPDGPPLTARQRARFRMKLAEDVDAAYAAIYMQAGSDHLVVVYGLKFGSAEEAVESWNNARAKNPILVGVAIGRIVAIVSGHGGQCFHTVETHLKSLAK